ncbi:phosphate ABC transporter permease PstA [Natronomonas marina]|uniref:phosphate ABC transporter permease PstA n=1 Tax=Natronomonas marina TaxID=2961939 RepID=UPI0020C99009|nr:phosphate ABC transporter permease PstA [Natronomonas marina]
MSDAYATETTLVNAESSVYDRIMDGVIALSVLGFGMGLVALPDVVSPAAAGAELVTFLGTLVAVVAGGLGVVAAADRLRVVTVDSQRVRGIAVGLVVTTILLAAVGATSGVTLATLLGVVLLVQGVVVVGAGVVSRFDAVDTQPDSSAGLLAGGLFAAVGLAVGATLTAGVVGVGPVALGGGLAGALVLGGVTVFPREDLGSTLPVGFVVGTLGVVVTTAAIGVGWQWDPSAIDGGFTGGVVIPIFAVFGSLVSGWAAGKSRAGFGAQGREYGAFLVVYLNGFMMILVMVGIVVFVFSKGLAYAFHGFSASALELLVLLVPVFALVTEFARTPPGRTEWHRGARELFRAVPLAVTGAVAALLTTVLVTGDRLAYPFTYTILTESRQSRTLDTAIAVTPEWTVGGLALFLPTALVAVVLYRGYGSLGNVGESTERLEAVRTAIPVGIALGVVLAGAFLLSGPTPAGLPVGGTVGAAVVVAGAVAALLLAALPVAAVVSRDGPLADRALDAAPLYVVGVFGGLGLLASVLVLQAPARTTPAVAGIAVVPLAGIIAALASIAAAGVAASANYGSDDTLRTRLLGEETVLALAGGFGYAALVGLHVFVTGSAVRLGGLAVATKGTLSWPMTMQAYIPLGAEPGGIMPAVVGTVWLVVGATLFAVPLGVGAAVFLTEYAEQGPFTAVVEVATNALWSTPSVVFGLFGAAFILPRTGNNETLLAGMVVLGFMLLPLVLITSREAVKAVPDEYRDASAALGVSRWETIKSVVLPAAMPGVITGFILGVGRIAGETAPLIIVLGSTLNATTAVKVIDGFQFVGRPPFVVNDQLLTASAALPTQVWAVIAAGVSGSPQMGWASATVLLMVVLTFYAVGITARTYFRRKLNYE